MADQLGVALITALLITALVAILASSMSSRFSLDLRRTGNVLERQQAGLLAEGAETFAGRILMQDAEHTEIDHEGEEWARNMPPMEVAGGTVSGQIRDAQARFNLNNLTASNGSPSDSDIAYFRRLLEYLELDPDIAGAAVDWMDTNDQPQPSGGAEDNYYTGLEQPYRTAGRPFFSASELRLVRGVDAEAWKTLEPLVVALPERTAVNINTAEPALLAAITPTVGEKGAEDLVAARGEEGFADLEAAESESALSTALERDPDIEEWFGQGFDVASEYFLVEAQGEVGRRRVTLFSLLHRSSDGVRTIQRAQGAF
ncbi:type II secretion system minor pseudopilin GspK [Thiohalospira sp.]|uniref:type II secretion system minor pseudopilin GspK n=1 Tax=Thiohalospira sp. TaxID=3080549 RepID=UPI00397FBF7D